jgi:hypothetical protein
MGNGFLDFTQNPVQNNNRAVYAKSGSLARKRMGIGGNGNGRSVDSHKLPATFIPLRRIEWQKTPSSKQG